MIIATASLRSVSPYSQSRAHFTDKLPKETADDYERRTWREHCHVDNDDHIIIPPMAFKNCLSEAAKFLSLQVPGKGKATYTKHFEAGVLVTDPIVLPDTKEGVEGEWLFLPADGVRGSGKRVKRCYPRVREWSGAVKFYVIDPAITEDVFTQVLREAGSMIGIGRWRVRNNGLYGRFVVESIKWEVEGEVSRPKKKAA